MMRATCDQKKRCTRSNNCSNLAKQTSPARSSHVWNSLALRRMPGPTGPSAATAPPIVHEVLRSPGEPMDSGTRADMEARFNHDFGNVRLHSDPKAAESARAVNALAYTVGSDVVLGAGETSPHTDAGQKVLAHELTHVVQQQSGGFGRQVLQRWALRNCSESQSVYVEDAFAKAYDGVSRAVKHLSAEPSERLKQSLWLAFRSDSDETIKTLLPKFEKLKEDLTSATVTCTDTKKESRCGTDFGFHSRAAEDYGMIYLCWPTFDEELNATQQANTLTHETAHKYLGVADTGYFTKDCEESARIENAKEERDSGTAGDSPATRLNNADSYACFVHFLKNIGKEARAKKAAEFKGDNLKLEADEDWIYTRTRSSSRATFRITEIPEKSGFRFKWTLFAGGDEFRVKSARSDTHPTHVFNEDAVWVYVPADVRLKLEEKGVTTAILRCDVERYRGEPVEISREIKLTVRHGQDNRDTSLGI
jgi:hypothetical protein